MFKNNKKCPRALNWALKILLVYTKRNTEKRRQEGEMKYAHQKYMSNLLLAHVVSWPFPGVLAVSFFFSFQNFILSVSLFLICLDRFSFKNLFGEMGKSRLCEVHLVSAVCFYLSSDQEIVHLRRSSCFFSFFSNLSLLYN